MIHEVLRKYFDSPPTHIEFIPTGLTNQNYLVEIDSNKYVVRIPYPNSEHIVDRHNEAVVLDKMKHLNLDVPLVMFDPTTGIKITRYVEYARHFDQEHNPNKFEDIAKLMRTLHEARIQSDVFFDPIQKFEEYKSKVTSPLFDCDFALEIIESMKSRVGDKILCHNDWVNGNMLFTPSKIYLIDYEYAGDNDPLFDVMSFLTENNIENQEHRNQFYNAYFGQLPDALLQEELDLYEAFSNLLWCMWAMMMHQDRNEPIFQQIAQIKYEALQRNFQQAK